MYQLRSNSLLKKQNENMQKNNTIRTETKQNI